MQTGVVCEPQVRADAAELVALRELAQIREKQATSFFEANQVLMAERDAAQADVERLKAEWDAAETELRIKRESLASACTEVERLRAIEARAQRVARWTHLERYVRDIIAYILTATPGDAPRICDPSRDGGHQFAAYEPGQQCYCGGAVVSDDAPEPVK